LVVRENKSPRKFLPLKNMRISYTFCISSFSP
jgi:hypothetical protein